MTDAAHALADHPLGLLLVGTIIILVILGALLSLVHWTLRRAERASAMKPPRPTSHMALHLGLGFVAVAALVAVGVIAQLVTAGSTVTEFDKAFSRALYDSSTPGWRHFFRVVTLMGTGPALGIASAVVGLYLLLRRRIVLAIGWGVAQLGAVVLVKAIKNVVERARPGLGDMSFFASGSSFPSGHVVRTLVFCGMGAYLIFRLTRSWPATVVACGVAALWSLVMAFSRLYLGAHFATDVLAGLIAATAWVAICISVVEEGLRRSAARRTI